MRAVTRPPDEPTEPGPEVVFLGRSNVGKSSLINRLLGAKNLARISSSPGRTQTINFYRVNESCFFIDLPGYGYARVPEAIRQSWGPMVEGFLERRRSRIVLAVLIVDSRHEASELDRTMQTWLEAKAIPYLVVATKSDKLSASERSRVLREAPLAAGRNARGEPILVSVRSGQGINKVWKHLDTALVG